MPKALILLLALLLIFPLAISSVHAIPLIWSSYLPINLTNASSIPIHPSSLNLLVGSSLVGSIGNLSDVGDNYVNFTEVSGSPGWDFYFNFTGLSAYVTNFNYNFRDFYSGNLGHNINVDLYNFSSASWIVYQTYHDEAVFSWHNFTVTDIDGLISSGKVNARIEHTSSGNTGHHEEVDYAEIIPVYSNIQSSQPWFFSSFSWGSNSTVFLNTFIGSGVSISSLNISAQDVNVTVNQLSLSGITDLLVSSIDTYPYESEELKLIGFGQAPDSVTVNGVQSTNWSYSSATDTLTLSPFFGNQDVVIDHATVADNSALAIAVVALIFGVSGFTFVFIWRVRRGEDDEKR